MSGNSFDARATLDVGGRAYEIHRLDALQSKFDVARLPYSLKVLLENALRHTDPGTAVEATVERIDGEVVLSVEDDGPGIPPELHDKVFERFFRGAGDRSGSSGLGLSIVRSFVELHGGRVEIHSAPGTGTRVTCLFPVEPPPGNGGLAEAAE